MIEIEWMDDDKTVNVEISTSDGELLTGREKVLGIHEGRIDGCIDISPEEQIIAAREKIKELEEDRDSWMEKASYYNKEVIKLRNKLRNEIDNWRRNYELLLTRNNELRKRLDDKEKVYESLSARRDDLRKERDDLKKDVDRLIKDVDDLEQERDDLRNSLCVSAGENSNLTFKLKVANESLEDHKRMIDRLEKINTRLHEDLDAAEKKSIFNTAYISTLEGNLKDFDKFFGYIYMTDEHLYALFEDYIAQDLHGYMALIEEMSELTKALCKYNRIDDFDDDTPELYSNIIEEIAHVLICIKAICVEICITPEEIQEQIKAKYPVGYDGNNKKNEEEE